MTITGYFKGFPIHHTGKSEVLYGKRFYEAIMLDGPQKGKSVCVTVSPEVKP